VLGGDIDALRRIVEKHDLRLGCERARHQRFLLVAAAKFQ